MQLQNYIVSLKKKIEHVYKDDKKNIITRFLRHLDNSGNIVVTKKILMEFFDNIKLLTDVYIDVENFLNIDINKNVFIVDFFESFATRFSGLVLNNIDYEIVAKNIYKIYFFTISPLTFEESFTYIENGKCEEMDKLKILSEYILNSDETFNDYEFNSTSYKLMSLGHLCKFSLENDNTNLIFECPEYAFARISLELTKKSAIENTIKTFIDIKKQFYIPSTPMYYYALKETNLLSSCFLLETEDNLESIGNLFKRLMCIQKYTSGTGVNLSKIRAKGRPVSKGITNSKGVDSYIYIIAQLTNNFKNIKTNRSASVNVCLSIEHPDVISFLQLKKSTHIKENSHMEHIFMTLSIPDEFMYRLLNNQPWYLISPEQKLDGKRLCEVYGNEYSELYEKMINDVSIEKVKISSLELFTNICNSMIETGGPFLFFRDSVNYTTNHKHYGIVQGTNLCTEILEYYDENETACCNLMSLNLKKYVKDDKTFDFNLFEEKIFNVVDLLNNSIDNSFYSDETCKISNKKTRPLGIGIQGYVNMLFKMNIPYSESKEIYKKITEAKYYYCLKASNILAKKKKYQLFDIEKKSPLMNGVFHFEMFNEYQKNKKDKLRKNKNIILSNRIEIINTELDWETLRFDISEDGICNSLFLALMPTSLSSGIYNNYESFEVPAYNINKREFSKFDIVTYNEYLVKFLLDNKYYTKNNVLYELVKVDGDFMKLENVPILIREENKKLFQTIYDISSQNYIEVISSNNMYIDQGKSTNIYVKHNEKPQLAKLLVDYWCRGGKTTYYFKSQITSNGKTVNDFQQDNCFSCQA